MLFSGAVVAAPLHVVPDWIYTVRLNDTLIGLGQTYLISDRAWLEVQQLNHVSDAEHLRPGTQLHIPANLLKFTPAAATLTTLSGAAQYRLPNDDAWHDAAIGLALPAGAELRTASNGFAVLSLANATQIHLQANSDLLFDTLTLYANGLMADSLLRLQSGEVSVEDNPQHLQNQHLQIMTPTIQAVVRGTDFRIASDRSGAYAETLDGLIGVSAARQTVLVPAGTGSVVQNGGAPSAPVALLPAPNVANFPTIFRQQIITFHLPLSDGVQAWHAEIAAASRPDKVLFQQEQVANSSNELKFTGLLNGDYVLRLRGIDRLGLQGYDATLAFAVHGTVVRIPAPRLEWPYTQQDITQLQVMHLQLSSVADFHTLLYDIHVQGDRWRPTQGLPLGIIYWRVAKSSANAENWGPINTFTYLPIIPPSAVDLSQLVLRFDQHTMYGKLPAPAVGLMYLMSFSPDRDMRQPLLMDPVAVAATTIMEDQAGNHFICLRPAVTNNGAGLVDLNRDKQTALVVIAKTNHQVFCSYPNNSFTSLPSLFADSYTARLSTGTAPNIVTDTIASAPKGWIMNSISGVFSLPRPPSGDYYIRVRQMRVKDQVLGPASTQKFHVPSDTGI